jgi:hypothetical protein
LKKIVYWKHCLRNELLEYLKKHIDEPEAVTKPKEVFFDEFGL